MSRVHVLPVDDLIEHIDEGDDCPCGPTVEAVFREEDRTGGWSSITASTTENPRSSAMSEHIGTVAVKVLPDLTEFAAIVASVPDAGLTVTEDVSFEYGPSGEVVRRITTRTVTKAV